LYDGPNGTGKILGNITLGPNNSGCTGYNLCVWSPVGIPLSTAAALIRFAGTADYIAIAKIALGKPLRTTTGLTSSAPQGSTQGQPVTTTATVSSPGTVPQGTVTFRANNALMGQPLTLVNGCALITTPSLPVGTNTIFALFKGANFTQSSATISQLVNP
jgi:Big-like domain-containing protein